MSEEPVEKPKLIIDDDWKERVQSEKEAAAASAAAAKGEASGGPAAAADAPAAGVPEAGAPETGAPETGDQETGAQETGAQDAGAQEPGAQDAGAQAGASQAEGQAGPTLPPASFATLVHALTAQALSSLGQMPDADGKTNVEIELGKHFIDTLAVLEEKTKGNLDQDESAALGKMLYELRMLFVHVSNEQSKAPSDSESAPGS